VAGGGVCLSGFPVVICLFNGRGGDSGGKVFSLFNFSFGIVAWNLGLRLLISWFNGALFRGGE